MNYMCAGSFDDIACGGSYMHWRLCRRTVGYNLASNGKYYKVLHLSQKVTSFSSVKAMCRAEGAQLAIAPYGAEDNRAMAQVRAQLSNMGMSSPTDFFLYIDGTDASADNLWILPDGQSGGLCLVLILKST